MEGVDQQRRRVTDIGPKENCGCNHEIPGASSKTFKPEAPASLHTVAVGSKSLKKGGFTAIGVACGLSLGPVTVATLHRYQGRGYCSAES